MSRFLLTVLDIVGVFLAWCLGDELTGDFQ
jgi:hypothetical protein